MICKYNKEKDIYCFEIKSENLYFYCNSKGEEYEYAEDIDLDNTQLKINKNPKKSKAIPVEAIEAAVESFDNERQALEWEHSDKFRELVEIVMDNEAGED